MGRAWTSIYIFLCKYRLVASHLHQINSTTMQAAASTNTITNTATPTSRPASVDELSSPADKNYYHFLTGKVKSILPESS